MGVGRGRPKTVFENENYNPKRLHLLKKRQINRIITLRRLHSDLHKKDFGKSAGAGAEGGSAADATAKIYYIF